MNRLLPGRVPHTGWFGRETSQVPANGEFRYHFPMPGFGRHRRTSGHDVKHAGRASGPVSADQTIEDSHGSEAS